MAVTKGRYTVGIKQTGGLKQATVSSSVSTVAKEFANMADQVFNVVQKKQEANFIYSFTEDVNKNYQEFTQQHRFDPASMRDATETYAKTKIQNVPLAYQAYATKYLAGKNATAINYATTQMVKRNDELFDAGYNKSKDELGGAISFNAETINANNQIGALQKVIDIAADFNDKGATSMNNIFAGAINANPLKAGTYQKDYTQSLQDNQAILLAQSMMAHGTDTKGAFNESKKFMSDGNFFRSLDKTKLSQSTKDMMMTSKNLINRKEINKKALNIYADYRNKSLDKLRTQAGGDGTFQIAAIKNKEVGTITHLGTARGMKNDLNNIQNYIDQNHPDISTTQQKTLITELTNTKKRLKFVEDAIAGKDNVYKASESDKAQGAEDILQYFNINDMNVITDPNNQLGARALDLFQKLNYVPQSIKQYLAPESMNIESDGFQEQFMTKLNVYKRLSNQGEIDVGGNNTGLYEIAIQNGWEALTEQDLRQRIKSWQSPSKPLKEKLTDLNIAISGKEEDLDNFITENMTELEGVRFAPLVAGKFLIDEALESVGIDIIETRGEREQKLGVGAIGTQGLFGTNVNSWIDLGDFTYPKDLVYKVKELTKDNFLAMNPSNLDMTDDSNKKMVKLALRKSIKQLDKLNYGFTQYHANFQKKGAYNYQKNPFEKVHPVSDREVRLEALGHFNAWLSSVKEGERNQYYGSDEKGNPYTYQQIRNHILTNKNAVVIEPVRGAVDEQGKPRFRLMIQNMNGDLIPVQKQNEYFSATSGWYKQGEENFPASISNIRMVAAKAATDDFMKEYGHLVSDDYKRLVEGLFYNFEKFRISAANFELPQTELMKKQKKEDVDLKPFKYLFNLMGKEIDYEKEKIKLAKIEKTYLDNLDSGEKIMANINNPLEKNLEAVYPPFKTPFSNYAANMRFKNFATNNFNKKGMQLNIRTNNYTGITIDPNFKYNGQLDIKSGNTAVFARPSDSYEATIYSLFAKSTLSKVNVEKEYGDNPTVLDVVQSFGIKQKSLYNLIEQDTGLQINDKINLFKFEDVRKVLLSITKHQMGNEFDKYYGDQQFLLNRFIKEGFDRAKEQMDFE